MGPRDDQTFAEGESLRVVGVNLSETVPHDETTPIEISFDRLLKPTTAVRQSFVIRDAFGIAVESPLVNYDPVLRIVRIENPRLEDGVEREPWLKDGQPYTLFLAIPKPGEDQGGFRALGDGTLAKGQKRLYGFVAKKGTPAKAPETDVFCTQVLPTLKAKCASCHSGASPDMGLDLSSAFGIQRTAIGVLARTTARSSSGTTASSVTSPFGRDMPIVAPRSPGTSVLLYKVLLAAPSANQTTTPSCGTPLDLPAPSVGYFAGLDGPTRNDLSERLSGLPMPLLPGTRQTAPGLSLSELRALSSWIARGAPTQECTLCK